MLGLSTPAIAMAWYGGGPFTPRGIGPYGMPAAPYYRAPISWSPYWMERPYPLAGYWPGYNRLAAPLPPATPWLQPGSPWQTFPGLPYNRWQVYGGMDQSGSVWMAFVYRGNINHLMGGNLFDNSWPGSGMGSAGQPFSPWGGGLMQPPVDKLFQDQGWGADRPA